jgi:hypothetical protein
MGGPILNCRRRNMKRLREWVAGLVSITFMSSAGDVFSGSGIVKEVKGNKISIHVSADKCVGHYELTLKDPSVVSGLRKGTKVFFIATGNPCTESDVQLLEIRHGIYEEAEDAQMGG